jgi:hypothetical protein
MERSGNRGNDGGLTESVLIITGTMGAGKTAVLREASDILTRRGIVHAAVDLDGLGMAHLPSTAAASNDDVMYENLGLIARNYAGLGVQRFLVARAIESGSQLKLVREMVAAVQTTVCRLIANLETMERRVETRDSGISQRELVSRVAKLDDILDRARLGDFAVVNENRTLTEVALELLVRAGWISG